MESLSTYAKKRSSRMEQMQIRLSSEERTKIEQYCNAHDLNKATFVRWCALKYIEDNSEQK